MLVEVDESVLSWIMPLTAMLSSRDSSAKLWNIDKAMTTGFGGKRLLIKLAKPREEREGL